MEIRFSEEAAGDTQKSEIRVNYNQLIREAQNQSNAFPIDELKATVKVGNYIDAHECQLGNLVKSEFVEFEFCHEDNSSSFSPDDIEAVMLEKIIKKEIGDDPSQSSSCEYDLYNNSDWDSSGSKSDLECDPFADLDLDCDPSFSQTLQIPICDASEPKKELTDSVDDPLGSSLRVTSAKNILPTKLQCQTCLKMLCSEKQLTNHAKICVASQKSRRFCVPCHRKFCNPQSYRKHALKQHGIKYVNSRQFKCVACSRSFARKKSLSTHFASFHQESDTISKDGSHLKLYKCPKCTLKFKSVDLLTEHMEFHVEEELKCPVETCGKLFTFKGNLKHHVRHVHSDDRPFKCQEPNCNLAFKTTHNLTNHMATHSTVRPFKCPHADCDSTFKNTAGVKAHLAVHLGIYPFNKDTGDERPFKCEHCHRTFNKKWLLTSHERTHSKVDTRNFQCPEPNCETKQDLNTKIV